MNSVKLKPMTDSQFDHYIAAETKRYARENVRAGFWSSQESIGRSQRAHKKLLSKGLGTKDHFFFCIYDLNGRMIGYIWFAMIRHQRNNEAFIYDFFILKKYRGKGLGKMTLEETAREAKKLGARKLSLHVFAHNAAAKALYDKTGFSVDSQNMSKKL